jgi:hypothetical protein
MPFAFQPLTESAQAEITATLARVTTVMTELTAWVIDGGREIIYVPLGGRGNLPRERAEPPDYHALFWKGSWLTFEGYEQFMVACEEPGLCLRITSLRAPATLRGEFEDIAQAIRDAVSTYHCSLRPHLPPVTVELPAPVYT